MKNGHRIPGWLDRHQIPSVKSSSNYANIEGNFLHLFFFFFKEYHITCYRMYCKKYY